jgi:glycosyltransferase involved in cell wall biosynthesis
LKDYLISLSARWAYSYASSVIALSKEAARSVRDVHGIPSSKVNVVYNPVDIKLIESGLKDSTLYGEVDRPFLLSVGRLVLDKDFRSVIRAFSMVKQWRDVKLVILGEGPQRDNLEKIAKTLGIWQDVHMPGYVDNPYPYMHKSSLLILASKWEGFGNVLVEAMATGTPVVSTNCPGGPSEILECGKWGHLVPVECPKALASAIIRTLDEPPASPKDLRHRAKRFDISTISSDYLSILFR